MTFKQARERLIHARARMVKYHAQLLIADKRIDHYRKSAHEAGEKGQPAVEKRQHEKLVGWEKHQRQLKQHIAHWRVVIDRRDEVVKEFIAAAPHLKGSNLVEGGTVEERFYFWVHQGMKDWRDYYGEYGNEETNPWAITNVPDDTYRSDCSKLSQYACKTIQIPDPTGQNFGPMFTGTVVANCTQVDRAYAESHFGTAVLFGDGNAFHMGLSMAHGDLIVQHGVPELEYGTFDEFGSGTTVRYYKFIS